MMRKQINVIDLFSGVGGLSLGFKRAGYNVVLANEIDAEIARSYEHNNPETLMINADIKEFTQNYDSIIRENAILKGFDIKVLEDQLKHVDVVIGGPPCQGFSMAGGRIRRVNEFIEDSRNFLFKYYFKVIQRFEPKYFVFENVEGILSSKNGEIIQTIKSIFADSNNFTSGGYKLCINVVNSADYGVPQARKRVIIIGSKMDFDFNHVASATLQRMSIEDKSKFITKTTVRDAIKDLSAIPVGSNQIANHTATTHSKIAIERISKIKPDENWRNLDEKINSVHSGAYGRLSWDKPAVTITTRFDTPSAGRYIHPEHNRTITPREAARLQTFPDDYVFIGSKTSICTQIGNAVPPQLAEFIAQMLLTKMEDYDNA